MPICSKKRKFSQNTILFWHFFVLIFPKSMKHSNGIKFEFSFDHPSNSEQNGYGLLQITISIYSQTLSAYALRYTTTGPQQYLWSFDIKSLINFNRNFYCFLRPKTFQILTNILVYQRIFTINFSLALRSLPLPTCLLSLVSTKLD